MDWFPTGSSGWCSPGCPCSTARAANPDGHPTAWPGGSTRWDWSGTSGWRPCATSTDLPTTGPPGCHARRLRPVALRAVHRRNGRHRLSRWTWSGVRRTPRCPLEVAERALTGCSRSARLVLPGIGHLVPDRGPPGAPARSFSVRAPSDRSVQYGGLDGRHPGAPGRPTSLDVTEPVGIRGVAWITVAAAAWLACVPLGPAVAPRGPARALSARFGGPASPGAGGATSPVNGAWRWWPCRSRGLVLVVAPRRWAWSPRWSLPSARSASRCEGTNLSPGLDPPPAGAGRGVGRARGGLGGGRRGHWLAGSSGRAGRTGRTAAGGPGLRHGDRAAGAPPVQPLRRRGPARLARVARRWLP
jgi:hypothetical protein